MGLGPIPHSCIMDYAAESGLFGDAAERFAAIIRTVDLEYMRLQNSSSKQASNEASVTDIEGTKHVLSRLTARASSATKPQPKKLKGRG